MRQQMNLLELVEQFDSESKCRDRLERLRWHDGVRCPRCDDENAKVVRLPDDRGVFECYSCDYQFTVTSGTMMHDTHLPLRKWFIATYLICESKKGISANQMKRTLNVTYRTAWHLCHRIRAAMAEPNPEPLSGIVEVDETWVGGKAKNMHKDVRARKVGGSGFRDHMTMVLGAVERGGDIRLKIDKRADRATLHRFIHENVSDDAEAIHTDEWSGYMGIDDENTRHETVAHRSDEWVRGDVHTNTVEGAWSLFKRSIVGSYHQLSAKHLDAYLDEFEFRFNNRENPYLFRDTLIRLLHSENLPYSELTAPA